MDMWMVSMSWLLWIVREWTQGCVCMRSQSSWQPHGAGVHVTTVTQKVGSRTLSPSGVGGRGSQQVWHDPSLPSGVANLSQEEIVSLWMAIVHWILAFLGIRGWGSSQTITGPGKGGQNVAAVDRGESLLLHSHDVVSGCKFEIINIYSFIHKTRIDYFHVVPLARSFLVVYGGAITSWAVSDAADPWTPFLVGGTYLKHLLSPLVSSNTSSNIHKQDTWGQSTRERAV